MFWTILAYLSTALSTAALIAATVSIAISRRLTRWQSWPFEQITKIEADIDDHTVQLAQHHDRLRRINARLAARERRTKAPQLPLEHDDAMPDDAPPLEGRRGTPFARLPGESDVEWKTRMRQKIATGGLSHG